MSFEERNESSSLLSGVVVLAAICLGSGLGVGLLYVGMRDDIRANRQKVFNETLAVVLGSADAYETIGEYGPGASLGDKVYVRSSDGDVLYAATGTAQGYQSTIEVLVSVKADRRGAPLPEDPVIHEMAVVSSQETPGLGENVNAVARDVSLWAALAGVDSQAGRPWFQEQFSDKRLSDLQVEKRAETEKVQAVTGATISSEATTKATRNAVQRIIEKTRELYGR